MFRCLSFFLPHWKTDQPENCTFDRQIEQQREQSLHGIRAGRRLPHPHGQTRLIESAAIAADTSAVARNIFVGAIDAASLGLAIGIGGGGGGGFVGGGHRTEQRARVLRYCLVVALKLDSQ